MTSLILVHIGKTLPDYFIDCVYQVLLWSNIKIYIVLSDELIKNVKYYLSILNKSSTQVEIVPSSKLTLSQDCNDYISSVKKYNLDSFRDSFWISTTCRFFYINACMEHFKLESAFHIENDVMIYTDLSKIKFENLNDLCVVMVKDSPNRVIPSIMFFPTKDSSSSLCKHIRDTMVSSPQFMNDMDILARYQYLVEFPSDPASASKVIYDGAAIGQFLGGPDPRNLPGSDQIINHLNNPLINKFINETTTFKMTDYEIATKYESGLKFYTIKPKKEQKELNKMLSCSPRKLTKIQNLHIHSKQLYQFSSVFDIKYNDIITGDRVLELCDYIIMTPDIQQFHRGTEHLNNKKIIISGELNDLHYEQLNKIFKDKQPVKLFIYTHILDLIDLSKLKNKIILYVHNSDHPFNTIVPYNVIKVYAQNPNISGVNLLPIGQANSMWPHGSTIDLYTVMKNTYYLKKTKNIYVNINAATYPYRKKVLESINGLFKNSEPKEYKMYLSELSKHYFCLCVRGNGLDTHRFWEALYLGTIPVIINNEETNMGTFVSCLNKLGVPFVCVNDLSKYSEDYFNKELYDKFVDKHGSIQCLEQLKIGYYS